LRCAQQDGRRLKNSRSGKNQSKSPLLQDISMVTDPCFSGGSDGRPSHMALFSGSGTNYLEWHDE
jgi:hypothetical protein